MPIESSRIVRTRNRGSKISPGLRIAVYARHTDHNGEPHSNWHYCGVNTDLDQKLAEWATDLNDTLIESETNSIQSAIENGSAPDSITLKHITNAEKAKAVIRALMLGKAKNVIRAAEYVQGFTDVQIEKLFTQEQRIKIRERQDLILSNQAAYLADVGEEI